MLIVKLRSSVFAVSVALHALTFADFAIADPSCDISPEKQKFITALLCGQFASEKVYQQSGPGCVGRSVEVRMTDSAAQIYMYELCGFVDFSNELKAATLRAMGFMQKLSICSSERVDLGTLLESKLADVARTSTTAACTPSIRLRLANRKSTFQTMIDQSKDDTFLERLMGKLDIMFDNQGNIVEAN